MRIPASKTDHGPSRKCKSDATPNAEKCFKNKAYPNPSEALSLKI
jgi:hypothetical protein